MRCSELMKTDIECVSPETSLRDAARKMRDENIGFLPVCNESMRATGTITDRDIAVRAVADGLPESTPVERCMTRNVISCRANDDVELARELMERHHKSRIVCTNESGRIEGIISLSDIADLDERSAARTLRRVSQREIRGHTFSPPGL
jgi:CBS domain-containing protein